MPEADCAGSIEEVLLVELTGFVLGDESSRRLALVKGRDSSVSDERRSRGWAAEEWAFIDWLETKREDSICAAVGACSIRMVTGSAAAFTAGKSFDVLASAVVYPGDEAIAILPSGVAEVASLVGVGV